MKRDFISLSSVLILTMLIPGAVWAVEEFKVSAFMGAVQIWFEVEAFDVRNPDNDQYYKVADKDGAFGRTINRTGRSGGMISWTFDIGRTDGGEEGTWYFWARLVNPSNHSDYLLVKGDDGDKDIPDAPPFPGGDQAKPLDNVDDRIFEADMPIWGWWGRDEGGTKDLQNGENTMYIFHRQGSNQVFWDVFMWTNDRNYMPTDEDYENATPMEAGDIAVQPRKKLSTTWGDIRNRVLP